MLFRSGSPVSVLLICCNAWVTIDCSAGVRVLKVLRCWAVCGSRTIAIKFTCKRCQVILIVALCVRDVKLQVSRSRFVGVASLAAELKVKYNCTINSTSLSRMKIVSFSEARNSLKTVLDRVVEDADYTVVTRRDAPDAVVMSLELFNSLMETVYLLKSPANSAHLERSISQFRQGKVVERDLLDE